MSTTARLISLLGGTSIFPPIQFTRKLLFSSSSTLRFHRHTFSSPYSSSSAVVTDSISTGNPETAVSSLHHPWPEWVSFVDRLNSKGYLSPSPLKDVGGESGDGNGAGADVVYKDMNLLKDACLNFARDRFDIFKSLSRQDIQTVVEKGCPNLFRKAVNSGKRLRVYVQLDEGDVCSGCNLRGSCDRAYVILKESESTARTTDIVRILLFYALDPLVISGGQKSPGRELIEVSARKLLSELIDLSETAPDPELSKPIAKAPNEKKKSLGFMDDELSRNVEMKKGDWMCPKCNFMNFYRNLQCRECAEDGPRKVGGDDIEMKKGDWICAECSFMNFSRNVRCLKCKAKGSKRVAVEDVEMKKGDWNCTQCGFMNFASNTKCLRCREQRPKRELNPGEWECPSCDFLNYRKNVVCLKCNGERPKGMVEPQYEDQIWRRPPRY